VSTKSLLVEDSAKHVFDQGPPRLAYSGPWDNRPCFTPQVRITHSKDEVDRGGTYLQVPMSPRREIEMGHNTSIQRPPMNPDHRLAYLQSHSTRSTNVPHYLSRGFVHQQNLETVIGTGSQFWDHPKGSYATVLEDESPNAPALPPARQFIQLGIGHVTSLQQPPMGRSYPPAFHQMVPSQVANVPYRPRHFNSSHLQTLEPMTATSPHYKVLTGVQHTVGGPYYQ